MKVLSVSSEPLWIQNYIENTVFWCKRVQKLHEIDLSVLSDPGNETSGSSIRVAFPKVPHTSDNVPFVTKECLVNVGGVGRRTMVRSRTSRGAFSSFGFQRKLDRGDPQLVGGF